MVEITANLAAIAAAGGWLVFGPIAGIVLCCGLPLLLFLLLGRRGGPPGER